MGKIITLFLMILSGSFSYAQIYLQGNVSGDLLKSTYIIKDKIIVPPNEQLTIASGTELQFYQGASIDVYGRIVVHGTTNQPVLFDKI